ncbi:hypothetical protein VPHK567_0367 [Vibrio phage K567]|nr:hypothetical protein MYOV011v1_p0253 [Vibrio phage 6E35.1a]
MAKSIHDKSSARQGRGMGNQCSDAWHNSPLWDNIGPNAKKDGEPVEEFKVEEKVEDLSELELRDRMRRLQAMAH